MKSQFKSTLLTASLGLALLNGCGQKPNVASQACIDLEKETDPAKRAELDKRCPRNGRGFEKSPTVTW